MMMVLLWDQLDPMTQLLVAAIAVLAVMVILATSFGAAAYIVVAKKLPPVTKGTIAFFHPFADGGGGGERVLWCAVQAVHDVCPHAQIVLYVHEGVGVEQLVSDAQQRFNIDLSAAAPKIKVAELALTGLLLPERYPRLTLLRQAWGAVRVGHEALQKVVPELFIDTTGWAFTFPLARLAGCRVAAYTHYPTVSSDMVTRVWNREATYNNSSNVAGSRVLSAGKLVYYQLVGLLYGLAGGCAHVVMANSSWTARHVAALFWRRSPPIRVYPPCDTELLQQLPLDRRLKQLFLVSVAQFRPEKNHRLQLEAFAAAKARSGDPSIPNSAVIRGARLKLVGSCRNADDKMRLEGLKNFAEQLGIEDSVDWCVDVPWDELRSLLGDAVGGLHTMRDEHFGISVVEYMAAGAIPIAHNSAGPKEDIVVEVPVEEDEVGPMGRTSSGNGISICSSRPGYRDSEGGAGGHVQHMRPTGFLAETVEQYTDAIVQVLVMDQWQRLQMAALAQRHAATFSVGRFKDSFVSAVHDLLPQLPPAGH